MTLADKLCEACHFSHIAPMSLLGPMSRAEAMDAANHFAWGEMEVDLDRHRSFLNRRLREAAEPGWKSRAGQRRRR